MGGSKYELTRAQKVVLKAIRTLSNRRVTVTGGKIRQECVDPGTADCVSKAAMYKALGALKEVGFVIEGEVVVPGRETRKKSYNLDYVVLGDSGVLDDL